MSPSETIIIARDASASENDNDDKGSLQSNSFPKIKDINLSHKAANARERKRVDKMNEAFVRQVHVVISICASFNYISFIHHCFQSNVLSIQAEGESSGVSKHHLQEANSRPGVVTSF